MRICGRCNVPCGDLFMVAGSAVCSVCYEEILGLKADWTKRIWPPAPDPE